MPQLFYSLSLLSLFFRTWFDEKSGPTQNTHGISKGKTGDESTAGSKESRRGKILQLLVHTRNKSTTTTTSSNLNNTSYWSLSLSLSHAHHTHVHSHSKTLPWRNAALFITTISPDDQIVQSIEELPKQTDSLFPLLN